MKKSTLIIYASVAIGVAAVLFFQSKSNIGQPMTEISIPQLNTAQTRGREVFDANCSVCHGKNASGSNSGPSLVQKIYQPRIHADGAFFLAVKNGARAHHWQFGSMMPVAGVEKSDVALIVQYVRALQRANGIK
jgi:mono/diheme cytochrome c family protein